MGARDVFEAKWLHLKECISEIPTIQIQIQVRRRGKDRESVLDLLRRPLCNNYLILVFCMGEFHPFQIGLQNPIHFYLFSHLTSDRNILPHPPYIPSFQLKITLPSSYYIPTYFTSHLSASTPPSQSVSPNNSKNPHTTPNPLLPNISPLSLHPIASFASEGERDPRSCAGNGRAERRGGRWWWWWWSMRAGRAPL